MLKINNIGYLIIIALIILFESCNNNKEYLTIKGELTNVDSPYFFIAMEVNDSLLVDTIFVDKQGAFSYKGNVDTLTMALLYFDNKPWSTTVFVDKKWNVEIKGDANLPDLIKINGGNVNDDLTLFKKENKVLFRNRAKVLQQIYESENPEMTQNYRAELKNVNFELTNRAKDYIEKNPEKIASVVLLQDFYKNNTSIQQLDDYIAILRGEAADFSLTQDLKEYSQRIKLSVVGALAPDFSVDDGKKRFELNKYSGKYLYLTFISRESDIYRETLPEVKSVYNKLKGKDIEFVSIVIDSKNNVSNTDTIPWPSFYDQKGWGSKGLKLYNVSQLPYSILISPTGYILDRDIAVTVLPQRIEELRKGKK